MACRVILDDSSRQVMDYMDVDVEILSDTNESQLQATKDQIDVLQT